MRADPGRRVGESALRVPIALLCFNGRGGLVGFQSLCCALYLADAFLPIAAQAIALPVRFLSTRTCLDNFRKFLDQSRFVAAGLEPERGPVSEKRWRLRMPDEDGDDSLVGVGPGALKGALPFAILPIPHNVAGAHHDHVELGLVERLLKLVV